MEENIRGEEWIGEVGIRGYGTGGIGKEKEKGI
jgi:hypothetical protein